MTVVSTPGRVQVPDRPPEHSATRLLWARRFTLLLLVLCGALLEVALIGVVALSYQLTEGPQFTDAFATPRASWLWTAVFPALQVLNLVSAPIIGPDRIEAATVRALMVVFGLAEVAYLAALILLARTRLPKGAGWIVAGWILVFHLTLAVMPGVFSTDWFQYAFYGRMSAVHGLNPYAVPPLAAATDPLFGWLNEDWQSQVSVYGPLWADLSSAIASATRGLDPVWQVYAYRVLASAAQLACVGVAWWLLGRLDVPARLASVVVLAWNPLVLLETAGSAHNDGLMLLFVLLAFAVLAWRRDTVGWLGGLLLLVLGAFIKFLPALIAIVWTAGWLRTVKGARRRALYLAAAALLSTFVGLVVSLPWLGDRGGIVELAETVASGGVRDVNALSDLAIVPLARAIKHATPSADSNEIAASAVNWLFRLAFLTYLAYAVRRVWRSPNDLHQLVSSSLLATLAALLLLLSQVLAWYYVLPVGLASLVGIRTRLTQFTILLSLTFLPVFYLNHYGLSSNTLLLAYVAIPLAWVLLRSLPRTRIS